jgi:predicted AAA+ superfamily ATPase
MELLEKSFILYKLPGLRRNMRSEVTKMNKYYFYDVGVRNAVIGNYNKLESRNDVGALWENFVVMERIKTASYRGNDVSRYFWRTHEKQEIDLVEEGGGKFKAIELKYSSNPRIKPPKKFFEAYPNSTFEVITPDNFLQSLGEV